MPSPLPDGNARAYSQVPLPSNTPPVPRLVSQVPLPPYAQPTPAQSQGGSGVGGKLMALNSSIMDAQRAWEQSNRGAGQPPASAPPPRRASTKAASLNSAIMAAQQEWEQQNMAGGRPSSSSSHSESSESTASDDSVIETTLALADSSARPVLGEKRRISSSTLEPSSRPVKRAISSSLVASPVSYSPLQANQSITTSHAQRHGQNGSMNSTITESDWLKYSASDSITSRADGTLYDYYHVSKDRMETMSGALIPTNYRLNNSSFTPFVCPDKACTKTFDTARALGGHFSAGHKGNAYNDNCDGTFTKVGFYKGVPGQKWRAIVVSRVSVNGSDEEDAYAKSTPVPFSRAHVSMTNPDPFIYATAFLPGGSVGCTRFLAAAYVRELCQLPRRRDLPASWIDYHRNQDLSVRLFALAVAYITGPEVFGLDVCNGGLHETGGRLSQRSIAMPFELSTAHKKVYFPEESCVGCHYFAEIRGLPNRCSWSARAAPFLHRYEKRVDGLQDSDDDDGSYAYPGTADQVAQQRAEARAVDSAIKSGKAARFEMPLDFVLPALKPPSLKESVESPSFDYNSGLQVAKQPSTTGFVYSQTRAFTNPASMGSGLSAARKTEANQPFSSSSVSRSARVSRNIVYSSSPEPAIRPSHPAQAPPPQLEMESWEVAPGRVVDSTHGENIAYSNAYLNGREPVEVSEDVAFNVLTIKPGDKTRWEAHESQLRTCSVASGKIEIKIGSNKIGAGPNSAFIIRPGESCVVTNKLYIDATVHCTTVKNYSLLS